MPARSCRSSASTGFPLRTRMVGRGVGQETRMSDDDIHNYVGHSRNEQELIQILAVAAVVVSIALRNCL